MVSNYTWIKQIEQHILHQYNGRIFNLTTNLPKRRFALLCINFVVANIHFKLCTEQLIVLNFSFASEHWKNSATIPLGQGIELAWLCIDFIIYTSNFAKWTHDNSLVRYKWYSVWFCLSFTLINAVSSYFL